MRRIGRREFLQGTTLCSYLTAAHPPTLLLGGALKAPSSCWLEVIIPFLIEERARNFSSEIVLPSGMFAGREGYSSSQGATEYELLLYNQRGEAGGAGRFELPPMHTRSVAASEIAQRSLGLGTARVRMRPRVPRMTHFADLFSAAYVRWNTGTGSSYIHAYPDPPQKEVESYHSVLTLPRAGGAAFLSLFNPSDAETEALVDIFDDQGTRLHAGSIPLNPYASILYDLVKRKAATDLSVL